MDTYKINLRTGVTFEEKIGILCIWGYKVPFGWWKHVENGIIIKVLSFKIYLGALDIITCITILNLTT